MQALYKRIVITNIFDISSYQNLLFRQTKLKVFRKFLVRI